MTPELLFIIIGAMVAGFVQGLSGFAFGLVAMSIWAWTLEPRLAAALGVCGALTGQLVAAVSTRRALNLGVLLPFVAGGLAGIPIGMALLPHLEPVLFKLGLGLLLVIWCPAMLMAARLPRISHGGRFADALAGLAGGVMGAFGGFTGAIPTLWCTLRGHAKDLQRSTVQNFNLAVLLVTMATYLGTGRVTRPMLPSIAIVVAAVLVPALLGNRVYVGLSETAFRRLVLCLLTASGVALLGSAVPQLL